MHESVLFPSKLHHCILKRVQHKSRLVGLPEVQTTPAIFVGLEHLIPCRSDSLYSQSAIDRSWPSQFTSNITLSSPLAPK